MIAYKLFRKRKDGTYGPLFINRKQRLEIGRTYPAEGHPTPGYAYRPYWHATHKPEAPHLTMRGRVWCRVKLGNPSLMKRPDSQGGRWYLADSLRILNEV